MIVVTADTVHKIFELTQKDLIYEEVLRKFFPRKDIRDEFKSELWLYFFEHPEPVIKAFNQKYFRYYFVSIVKNQAISNSKNWFSSYSPHKPILMETLPEESEEINPFEIEDMLYEKEVKIKKVKAVEDAIAHYLRLEPRLKPEFDVFKMYYFEHMTMREISKHMFNIPLSDVYLYIRSAEERIKRYMFKHKPNIQ